MPTQSTQFSYITFAQMKAQLAAKLNDPENVSWSDAENGEYIIEALRFFNVLTQWWTQDFTFTLTAPLASDWIFTNNTSQGASPRAQTLTETDLYSILCYHLLEPQLIAGVWQGTNQFSATDLQSSAQTVRDEILQLTACNMGVVSANITPGTNRTYLPDSTLDVRRMRYTGAVSGVTNTLVKGDSNSFLRFSPNYRQIENRTPTRYDILGSPPLALTVDFAPNETNSIELLVMNAGNTLNPVSPQPLQIPDDWLFVLKWGVLFDLLSKEAESTDHGRANYAQKRYEEGLKAVMTQPWLLTAEINNIACDITPVIAKDRYSVNWQSNPNSWATIVIGGIDLISPAPIPLASGTDIAITLTMIGNAPIPAADDDFVQIPRDAVDSILYYAQFLAPWKYGGDEAFEAGPLRQSFIEYCMKTNARLRESGIFATDLRPDTSKQELNDPRFAVKS